MSLSCFDRTMSKQASYRMTPNANTRKLNARKSKPFGQSSALRVETMSLGSSFVHDSQYLLNTQCTVCVYQKFTLKASLLHDFTHSIL